ncbi:hypothetical protein EOD29_22910 [Mesorhizobium sp. M1A.T.Ca.IN.004.03.1.1]|uniref:hypothetical protein n=1 Tax=Mesorhizobium sp. M1A.T.Ca.IN.004.03.1.1 TaxID=2496795 RepID=UPI000FCA5804|nr:hypothetical protein [Mesorhizobium sp. M1A.T.Ca.IN.004.03.1.1]RUV41409.1 hypothetical protein EOD29_22910 [Mesorhizobium sp. M1A.T.Ca.IN.004.03.1.1]
MADKQYTRMSLIERSALTFQSFLARDFGNRFYQSEFLDGITARRMETIGRLGKASSQAFVLATVLAFFDLISGSSFTYGGLTLQITKDLAPIISLMTAGALLNTTFAFIDDQIIFRILLKIGSQIKIQNFPLLLVDKMAHNLWGDAIVPRLYGQKSGRGQRIAVTMLGIVALLVSAAMYLYPALMVGRVFFDAIWSDTRWVAKAIASLAVAVTVWALLLGAIFMTKFTFYPADWHESTDQPTEEFIRRMQAEIAQDDRSASDTQ